MNGGAIRTDVPALLLSHTTLYTIVHDVCMQDVFELLCNFGLIPEWDVLFKSGQYLTFASDPAGRCEVAHIHIVYGLPGEISTGVAIQAVTWWYHRCCSVSCIGPI